VIGWNVSDANLRWNDDYVLVDLDAAPADPAPSTPAPGMNPACAAYGAPVLVLPDASLDAVRVNASLLYPTVSWVGTHAALWVTRD